MTIDEAIETVRKFERDAVVNQSSELRRLLLSALTLADEVERLRRGDFTEQEFQNLCHNFDESDERRFKRFA